MSQLRGYDTPTAPPTTPAARGPAEEKIKWDLFVSFIPSLALTPVTSHESCYSCRLDLCAMAVHFADKIQGALCLQ